MPPPNANGNLHIGHGLTIALEDSLTRFYRLLGKSTWYVPGADHAGFETWVVYERALEAVGHSRFEYSRDELYARVCACFKAGSMSGVFFRIASPLLSITLISAS